MNKKMVLLIFVILVSCFLLAACGGDEPAESSSTGSGTLATVDGVTVDLRNSHYYAIVTGTYPDPCTRISDISQDVSGDTFVITLSTDRPEDLVCAQMITAYGADLLLETGGLLPGDFTVEVNGVTTNFSLGQ